MYVYIRLINMDEIRNSMCKTCSKNYTIPICILFSFSFLLLYMFFPSVFTFLIYSSPLVGLSFLVHRIFLGIDRRKVIEVKPIEPIKQVKQVEEDDRRKKFAKSRRSFKSRINCTPPVRRNAQEKNDGVFDTIFEDESYALLSKSFHDLLVDKTALIEEKPKEIREVNAEPPVGRGIGESSSSKNSRSLRPEIVNGNNKDKLEGVIRMEMSEDDDDEPRDKAVQWTEDNQKNVMDLGLLETERNRRLESLMERRRSRKNLGFQEKLTTTENHHNNAPISALKITKKNPFLEQSSRGMDTPGSAPSSLLSNRNPFDIPYDPHEEKPDLSGDNFHEEFTVVHPKEPVFCRHQSFSLGAFSHHPLPEIAHDKHEISFYKDHGAFTGLGRRHRRGESSSERIGQEDERHATELGEQSDDSYDERKADIFFFYGGDKKVCHAPSHSIVSDLQVEVSEDGSCRCPDDFDLEKDHTNLLFDITMDEHYANRENDRSIIDGHETRAIDGSIPDQETEDKQCVSEQIHPSEPSSSTDLSIENEPRSLNSGGDPVDEGATDGSTEAMAPMVGSSSPISVLQPMSSFANNSDNRNNSEGDRLN